MRSRLLCAQGSRNYCRCLWLSLDHSCRAGELLSGTVELFQIALGKGVICLSTSTHVGFRVRSGEFVDKPVGIPDACQWMRVPEWSVDPLSAIALAYGQIYIH